MMKALILAAGFGSRLVPITRDLPKALVPVLGRPILDYQLRALSEVGICDITIVIGYHGEKIQAYATQNFQHLKLSFIWNTEYAKTNSAYSFWLAREAMRGHRYCHLNCDILFSQELLRQVVHAPENNTIAARCDLSLGKGMELIRLEKHRIVQMNNELFPGATAKAFGLAKFSQESTSLLIAKTEEGMKQGDRMQNYYGLIRTAVHELDYHALVTDRESLLEINTHEDLRQAEEQLRND